MIEPLLSSSVSPSAAERLAALRAPSKKRAKPAHTSKVLAAGISTTALLGMVAVMGWQSGTGTAQSTAALAPAAQAVTPVAPVLPVTPASTAVTTPGVVDPTVAQLAPAAPVAAVPVPATAAPVVIPVAVPVAQAPVQQAAPAASNTTTKTSG